MQFTPAQPVVTDQQYRHTCEKCQAQITFKRSEVVVDNSTRGGSLLNFACPSCSAKVSKPEYQFQKV